MFFRRRRPLLDELEVDEIVSRWDRACEGAGLVRQIQTVSGPTVLPPKIVHIILGPPRVLSVHLQPGMTVADVREAAPRIAPHMGAYGLRVEPRGLGEWAVVTLLDSDPLVDTYRAEVIDHGPILLGVDEDGRRVEIDRLSHSILAGSTGSGKSVAAYGLLAQLHRRRDVLITGVDASGLLFRPMPEHRWRVSGLRDPYVVEKALADLVDEMDRRITAIPPDADALSTDQDTPQIIVVLEEWPGTLRALDATDPKLAKRVRLHVARLLAESRKAGFAVVLICQRAEAAIIGAAERAQCPTRLTFGAWSVEDVRLLHPECPVDVAEGHVAGPAGVALVSMPGVPLRRVRSPFTPYSDYAREVGRDSVR